MPLPPEEAENGENAGNEEPKLQFSYVECLLYSFHQLGRKLPDFLTAKLNAEKLKDFKIRWYMIAVPQSLIKVNAILRLPWFCFHFARAFSPPFLTTMQKNARATKQECIQLWWHNKRLAEDGLLQKCTLALLAGFRIDIGLVLWPNTSDCPQLFFIDNSTCLTELWESNCPQLLNL